MRDFKTVKKKILHNLISLVLSLLDKICIMMLVNSGIGLLGCLAIYALLNLMAVSGVAICKYSLELQHFLLQKKNKDLF